MRSLRLFAGLFVGLFCCGIGSPAGASPAGSNTVVRIEIDRGTNRLGTVDVELFDHDKPETVRNVLLYTRSGAYSNMFLHRCVPGFVIQGGGFAVTNPLSSTTFTTSLEVTNLGRLTNEFAVGPRLTNSFGTIAMAKVGNDPNSATSQWFFNLGDNSANLDNQNGGFTVFGRVLESTNSAEGTNVLQHFNTLTNAAGIVTISGQSVFNELPVSYTNGTRAPAYRELYHTRLRVLNETNTPGMAPPSITVTNPAPDAPIGRYTNQAVIVSGTASDDRGVARVLYRLGGGASEIAAGTNAWQIGLNPRPGFNTVTLESIDWEGNHSTNPASVTFYYVSQLPLKLETFGQGKVTGLTNGQLLQAGSVYAATATPAKGHFFDGWTGSVSSASANLTFQVATNATNFNLAARFTRDFFPVLAGSYQGLMRETNASATPGLENTGFLTLSLNRKGGFSGRIRHRGGTYSFIGRFDRNGATFLQGTVGGVNRTITLRLDTTNQAGVIRGNVSGSASSSVEVQLERMSRSLPATNAPTAGDYPFVIAPPAIRSPFVPGGNGYGRAILGRKGTLKIRGTLGDGTPFVGTARASRAPRWPFYLNMARGQAVVQGWIAAQTNSLSTLESRLAWVRAVDPVAATYPAGFSNQVTLTGLRFQAPAPGNRYLNWVTGLARLEGANLALAVTNTVRLETNNTIAVRAPNPSSIQISLDLNTGLVNGSFIHPWAGTTNALHGVIFKPGESIRGQFLDGDQTGSLTVNLAPFLATQTLANVTLEGFTAAISEGGLIRFDTDGTLTLTNAITLPFDTALDANGHRIEISGAGATRLFVVPTNQTFSAIGVTFGHGIDTGTNGASGDPPQPGGDACGAGVLNLGGTIGFTNCVFTNFVVMGGDAGIDTGTNGAAAPGGRALGAAICNRGGRAALDDCLLVDNLAIAGAGTSPPLTNRLSSAPGSAMGGAVFSDGPELVLHRTTFRRSEARSGNPRLLPDGTASRSSFAAGGAVAAAAGSIRISSNSYQTNFAIGVSIATNTPGAAPAYGGALFVESNVTAVVGRSVFSGNTAAGGSAAVAGIPGDAQGGAIYGVGSLQLTDCTLDHNTARGGASSPAGSARGGAIAAVGPVALTNSTLNHNVAEGGLWTGTGTNGTPGGLGQGGAVHIVRSNLTVLNSTFAFNQALGGPETGGALTNGNLPGNRFGGAIAALSNVTSLAGVTIAFNSAGAAAPATNTGSADGGGIFNLGSTFSLRASLLVSNAPVNHRGPLSDAGYNFSSDDSVALVPNAGIVPPPTNVNVFLGPLTDNGGPTLTMTLALGSPARDKIPTNSLPSLLDQRGVRRPQPVGGLGDAGAVETEMTNAAPIFIPPPPASLSVRAGTNVTFQATAVATNPISFFWIKNGLSITNATNTTLILVNVQPADAGLYALVATNAFGVATSGVATLTVDATPIITNQPVNVVITPGDNASFVVRATPTNALNYFWYHDGVRVGPNAATLPITNASPSHRGSYFVVVSNAFGVATSEVATLTFNALALQLVTQPANLTLAEGQNANFAVVATGFPGYPITYQWFFNDAPIPGRTTNILTITNITTADAGTYRVVVTNAFLSLTSSPATLTLNLTAPPVFSLNPTGGVARAGSNFTFQAFASGASPLTYSWLYNGAPLAGAAGPVLVITNAQASNAGPYAAVATNNFGSATSLVAVLTVDSKPRILTEPADLLAAPGAMTNFVVQADGPALVYAWYHDGQPIADATGDTLQITNASPADRGAYLVIITNDFGSSTSRVATLTFDTNALAILTQPTNTVATTGHVATFTVVVGGIPPFAFQWTFGGVDLADETNSALVIPFVAETNAGNYQVIVTNAYLSVTSVVATLIVDTNAALFAPAQSPDSAAPKLSISITNGRLILQCEGRGGETYRLLQAEEADLRAASAPSWKTVASERMPDTGRITWTFPLPSGRQAFYRAVTP